MRHSHLKQGPSVTFHSGFTLIEVIVVMVIVSILAATVAVFIRRPMEGVIDMSRRAALADTADTAMRRIRRDAQRSLPNSLRVTQSGAVWWIEFLPVLAAGRYCVETDCGATPLDLVHGNTSLNFAGPQPVLSPIPSGTEVAIYNLGIAGANAYAGDNTATLSAIASNSLSFASKVFPFDSPGKRFHLIGTPVSYACGYNGTLTRVWGYAKQSAQPVAPPAGSSTTVLATNLSNCDLNYQQAAIDQNGLLYLNLQLTLNAESVSLSHAIQINNVP